MNYERNKQNAMGILGGRHRNCRVHCCCIQYLFPSIFLPMRSLILFSIHPLPHNHRLHGIDFMLSFKGFKLISLSQSLESHYSTVLSLWMVMHPSLANNDCGGGPLENIFLPSSIPFSFTCCHDQCNAWVLLRSS